MVDKYIEQAPNGEKTAPAGTEMLPITDGASDWFIQILNLIVRKIRETSGPTTLSMGAVADGEFLRRSGTNIVGIASPASVLVQAVHTQTGAVATGTTTVPNDDTIPQNTEGTEFMTLAITPTSAANKLIVEVVFNYAASALVSVITSLFKDATADALAVVARTIPGANYQDVVAFKYEMVAGTTSPITFKVRSGPGSAATVTFNGFSGARKFGGAMASSIRISEIKV